jgi:hypothetical protein
LRRCFSVLRRCFSVALQSTEEGAAMNVYRRLYTTWQAWSDPFVRCLSRLGRPPWSGTWEHTPCVNLTEPKGKPAGRRYVTGLRFQTSRVVGR